MKHRQTWEDEPGSYRGAAIVPFHTIDEHKAKIPEFIFNWESNSDRQVDQW